MPKKFKTKRRRLHELHIAEISAVDNPAQEHALRTIMKRRDDDESSFEDCVAEIAERDGCSGAVAMEKARREFPDAFAAFQDEDRDEPDDAPMLKQRKDAAAAFETCVAEIQRVQKVSASRAMELARVAHPAEFQRFQSA